MPQSVRGTSAGNPASSARRSLSTVRPNKPGPASRVCRRRCGWPSPQSASRKPPPPDHHGVASSRFGAGRVRPRVARASSRRGCSRGGLPIRSSSRGKWFRRASRVSPPCHHHHLDLPVHIALGQGHRGEPTHNRHHVGPPNCESTRKVRLRVATADECIATADRAGHTSPYG